MGTPLSVKHFVIEPRNDSDLLFASSCFPRFKRENEAGERREGELATV